MPGIQMGSPEISKQVLSGSPGWLGSVWRCRGKCYAECCIRQQSPHSSASVMVWARISCHHRTHLVIVDGNMTARRYTDQIMQPYVFLFLQQQQDVTVFQLDNTCRHSARVTQEFLEPQGVNVLPWPAYSPDMNPIKHLLDQLGRQLSSRVFSLLIYHCNCLLHKA
uniref:Tc1-like transposase DDE domain-containing protein n=1 Tax=Sphaeramia orbicularis TaxID=375764 RepID=A0A673B7H6_9TELE